MYILANNERLYQNPLTGMWTVDYMPNVEGFTVGWHRVGSYRSLDMAYAALIRIRGI